MDADRLAEQLESLYTAYFASPFEAPVWRKDWVEEIDPVPVP